MNRCTELATWSRWCCRKFRSHSGWMPWSFGNLGKQLGAASDCLNKSGSCLLAAWLTDAAAQWLCRCVHHTQQSSMSMHPAWFVCLFVCVIFKHRSEDEMKAAYFISPSKAGQNKWQAYSRARISGVSKNAQ